jgi:hypothetical protein
VARTWLHRDRASSSLLQVDLEAVDWVIADQLAQLPGDDVAASLRANALNRLGDPIFSHQLGVPHHDELVEQVQWHRYAGDEVGECVGTVAGVPDGIENAFVAGVAARS